MSVQTLYTAATGMTALETKLDVIANNLANVNTTGFKRDRANFEDLFYQNQALPGAVDAAGNLTSTGVSTGLGTSLASVQTDFTQGAVSQTNRNLDIAIFGKGFFQVADPATGEIQYTRAGHFDRNANGELVVASAGTSRVVQPPINIPNTAVEISVSPDGLVGYAEAGSPTLNNAGQIQLATFINPELMTLNSLSPEKFVFKGAAAVTVHPRVSRPSRRFGTKKLKTRDVDSAKKLLAKQISKHLTQRSGQKNDWQVDFMIGKRNAEKIIQASHSPRIKGSRAPWTGKQRFWVEVGTEGSVIQFPVYAQVRPKEFVVTTTRAIRRGQRITTADIELRPAPPQLRGAQVVYHLEDVVGRESKRSMATGQPVDARSLVKTTLVKRRQLVTVFAKGPGIVVRMTARSLENGTKGDLINIQSLEGRRKFSARVVGPQEVEIHVSPTIVTRTTSTSRRVKRTQTRSASK